MRRRLAIVSLFAAWLFANGAMWDAAQVFAWARMFAGYTQTLSWSAALDETFDASKPCDLCRTVAKAKEVEQKQAPQIVERSAEKLLLACDAPARVVIAAPFTEWPEAPSRAVPSRTERVPVPPPRA